MRAARLIGVLGVPWAHIDARPSFPGFDSVPQPHLGVWLIYSNEPRIDVGVIASQSPDQAAS